MIEPYNSSKTIDENTWFNHLLLQSDIMPLVKLEGFDSSCMMINLTINNVPVRIQNFNEVLEEWSDRIEAQIKGDLDYFKAEEAVTKRAEELIKDKLHNISEVLREVEDSLWKLES